MSYCTTNFRDVLESFQLDASSDLFDAKSIQQAFADAECDFGHQEHTVFDKSTTLWAFLYEMVHTGKQRTLQAAVHAVQQKRIAQGLDPNSANTGAYSEARGKIGVAVPLALVKSVAKSAELSVPPEMLLFGEHVTNRNGSEDTGPDTKDIP